MRVPAARAVSRPAPRSPPCSTLPSRAVAIKVIVVVVVIVIVIVILVATAGAVACSSTSQLSKRRGRSFIRRWGGPGHSVLMACLKTCSLTTLSRYRVTIVSGSYLPPLTAPPPPGLPSGKLGSTGWNPRHAAQFVTRFLTLLALRLMKWYIGLLTPQFGHSLVRPARLPGGPGGGGAGAGAGAVPPAGPPALAISVCDDVWCD